MQKNSFMFLLILSGVALIGAYEAFFPMPANIILDRFFALSSLYLICISLMIGPLAVIDTKYASLIEPRRSVGIAAFVFAAIHSLLALDFNYGWQIGVALSFIPALLSIPAALILLAMTLTSSDWAVQKMGMGNWKKLQMLIYPAYLLILAHFILMSNGLFLKIASGVFVNLAEVAMLILSGATILLQACGYYLKRKRVAEAKAQNAAVAAPETKPQPPGAA